MDGGLFHYAISPPMLDINVFCIKVVNRTMSECNTSLVVGINNGCRNLSHIVFFIVFEEVIYSASTNDVTTVSCFFDN